MKEKGEHFCVDRRLCPKMEPSWGTIHVNASTVPKNCGFIKKIGGTNQKKSALCPNPSCRATGATINGTMHLKFHSKQKKAASAGSSSVFHDKVYSDPPSISIVL
jgi:hypothetical protein